MNGPVVPFGVRYLRMRLDTGPLEEFHRALNCLRADTCERGRCGTEGTGECGKHARRRRQQENRKVEP